MDMHVCARCEGSGQVTGGFGWEVPWPRWAGARQRGDDSGLMPPHACPDCGGAGTLLEMVPEQPRTAWPGHGHARRSFDDNVTLVLHTQRRKLKN